MPAKRCGDPHSGSDADDANDDEQHSGPPCGGPSPADFARMQRKMDNLPTIEKLRREADPHTCTPEALHEASCFVRDMLLSGPLGSDRDCELAQRRLQKRHRLVIKKAVLLTAYKLILKEGAPAPLAPENGNGAGARHSGGAVKPSKRHEAREAKKRARVQQQQKGEEREEAKTEEELKDLEDIVARPAASEPSSRTEKRRTHEGEKEEEEEEDQGKKDGSGELVAAERRITVAPCPALERYLISKAPRSQSGVLVVTVFTSAHPDGQAFSCQWNCYYCPNEPNQPRSYLLNEPGVRRANQLSFDAYRQFTERVQDLVAIGHPADKIELLVLGGTWESYPLPYRERFIRDLFYAANTIFDDPVALEASSVQSWGLSGVGGGEPYPVEMSQYRRRPPLDLLQEQLLNEQARCKIIGVTLETRPDTVTPAVLQQLRRFGCTRVQLGIQHTDDAILVKVNRQSTREDAMRAIKLLKDACFKVDIHLMPDLPGATPEIDKAMFDDVLGSPYLQADQWKIYPCMTTPFTLIEQWYREGSYTPYGLENLVDVLLYAKTRVQPWVRLNRVIRDIPESYVLAGVEVSNLRQLLGIKLHQTGRACKCIRCREVKGDRNIAQKLATAVLKERVYEASEGSETFLSFETPDEATIFGFLRLRTNVRNAECPFPELDGCALIRELHVYGNLIPTSTATKGVEGDRPQQQPEGQEGQGEDEEGKKSAAPNAQHSGLGTRLLVRAEELARAAGYDRIAVISGVGVRGYYRRRGYQLRAADQGGYLIKDLTAAAEDAATAAPPAENKYMLYGQEPWAAPPTTTDSSAQGPAESVASWRGTVQGLWRRLSGAVRKRSREE